MKICIYSHQLPQIEHYQKTSRALVFKYKIHNIHASFCCSLTERHLFYLLYIVSSPLATHQQINLTSGQISVLFHKRRKKHSPVISFFTVSIVFILLLIPFNKMKYMLLFITKCHNICNLE